MHVPYSMDDSEPDLYGSLGGHHMEPMHACTPYRPMFEFDSIQDLLSHPIVREHVRKTIESKQRQIDELRIEILNS